MPAKYYKTISQSAARELILAHRLQGRGRTFSIAWDRRTTSRDGERLTDGRELITGRFGVTKHLKNRLEGLPLPARPGAAYNRHAHRLFCLWATSRVYNGKREVVRDYRCIPFDRVRWLKVDGCVYKVETRSPCPQY